MNKIGLIIIIGIMIIGLIFILKPGKSDIQNAPNVKGTPISEPTPNPSPKPSINPPFDQFGCGINKSCADPIDKGKNYFISGCTYTYNCSNCTNLIKVEIDQCLAFNNTLREYYCKNNESTGNCVPDISNSADVNCDKACKDKYDLNATGICSGKMINCLKLPSGTQDVNASFCSCTIKV